MGQKNIIAGVVLILISLTFGYLTSQLPQRTVGGDPGITFFPWIIALSVLVLSIAMTIQGWLIIRQGEAQGETEKTWQRPPIRVIAMIVLYVVFIALLPYLGFLVASVPFFTILMYLYGGRHKVLLTLAGPCIPIAIYFLFRHAFLIPLPKATLEILGG